MSWSDGIQDAWDQVAVWVPKFIGFLVILLIGYLVAKAIARILDRVLERWAFHAHSRRSMLRRLSKGDWAQSL